VLSAWKKKQFTLIFPAGLEKLIPIPVRQAAIEAKQARYEYGMGLPAGLFAYPSGRSITEIDAVRILSGAIAVPLPQAVWVELRSGDTDHKRKK